MIGVCELAHALGMSRSWVEKHPDQLPPADAIVGGRRGWSRETVETFKETFSRPKQGRPRKEAKEDAAE